MKCSICGVDLGDKQFVAKCIKCGAPLCDDCSLTHQFTCNECSGKEDKKIDLEFVRRSYIDTYNICPYQFKLLAIDNVDIPNNIYADIGIKLHELFEEASLGKINKEEMTQQFNEWWRTLTEKDFESYQRKLTTKDFMKQQYEHGLISINNFFEFNSLMPAPHQTETTVFTTIDEELPKIRITFDRLNHIKDNMYDLVDYKTGKVYVGKRLEEEIQIPLYIYSVIQNFDIDIRSFRLLFTSEGKERVYVKRNEDEYVCTVGKKHYVVSLSKTIDSIRETFTQIKNGKFNVPHDINPWYCDNRCMCKKAGYCAGGFNQKWKNA